MKSFYQLLLIPVLLALSLKLLPGQCDSEAGTMNLEAIVVCKEDPATAIHNGDEVLQTDYFLNFVLHDQPGTALGEVLAISTTPVFDLNGIATPNTTYYISAVAGTDSDADGVIDLDDPCLKVAAGTPVLLSQPLLQCSTDFILSCNNDPVELSCWVSDAVWPITFEWFDSDDALIAQDSQLMVNEAGLYRLVVTDANGCTSEDTEFLVQSPPEWEITLIGELFLACEGEVLTIDATVFAPGVNFEYVWSNGTTSPTIIITEPGEYCLTVIDNFACEEEACVTVVIGEPLQIQLETTDASCESTDDGSIDAIFVTGGAGPYWYQWNNGANGEVIVNLSPGLYEVTVTDANGCSATAAAVIGVSADAPQADAGANQMLSCSSPSVTLDGSNSTVSGEVLYQWTLDGVVVSNDIIVDVSSPGQYILQVTDASDGTCFSQDVVWIQEENLSPELNVVQFSCDSILVYFSLQGDTSQIDYVWTLPNGETVEGVTDLYAQEAGLFSVELSSGLSGCTGSTSVWVDVSPGDCSQLTGTVFWDEIDNCVYEDGELGLQDWILTITDGTTTYYRATDNLGNFDIALYPGVYTVTVNPPSPLWLPCEPAYTIEFTGANESADLDIPIGKIEDCPYLSIDISTPLLRRCFTNDYYINYCNDGTGVAADAYVEILLDPFMGYHSSELPLAAQDGNLLTFDLGDIEIGECGGFWLKVILNCDADLGQTHCVEAEIFPNDPCVPPGPGWSGASLEVEAECTEDEVIFRIINTGTGNMIEPTNYIVIEDGVMMITGDQVLLNSGQDSTISLPANGVTYRLEVEQVAEHPGLSMPSITIEGCGTDGSGNFSTGFVTQLPMDDNDPFLDVDCRQNIGSWDPNDKMGFPRGVGEEHYILANTDLEYQIRFQNTGTDTAFNIIIRDTLSPLLDITSVRPTVSSHPYTWDIDSSNVLVFTYENIMLPDSNVNEPASHGFIRFTIAQQPDLALESLIENSAAIYFDFNEPIITNTTFHRIGEDFIEVVNTHAENRRPIRLQLSPNPMGDQAQLQLLGWDNSPVRFSLYDLTGKRIRVEEFDNNQHQIQKGNLMPGLYFFRLESGDQLIGNGKILID